MSYLFCDQASAFCRWTIWVKLNFVEEVSNNWICLWARRQINVTYVFMSLFSSRWDCGECVSAEGCVHKRVENQWQKRHHRSFEAKAFDPRPADARWLQLPQTDPRQHLLLQWSQCLHSFQPLLCSPVTSFHFFWVYPCLTQCPSWYSIH